MKDVSKMSQRELRNELRTTRKLLATGRCPESACRMGVVTEKQISSGEWEHSQCQWCAKRSELIGDE